MKILFLAPYPEKESPSQRYRFEHYLGSLREQGFDYDYRSFLNLSAWKIFFTKGNQAKKILGLLSGFLRRWVLMFQIGHYDFVYIHREAAPMGPPIFEWIIARIWRKKIIYDFDDAIWIPVASSYNKFARYIKWFSKIGKICSWSYTVTTGNEFLASFARRYNKNVVVIPTVVDTEKVHNRLQVQSTPLPVIGWTGTFSTLKYLNLVLPVLQRLQQRIPFSFLVIANSDPQLPLKNYQYIHWSKETEAEDLLRMHIGLMPLYDSDIEKGKCGFKAIQYMALGIPAVVSDVGVNKEIVDDGFCGFVCRTEADWEKRLESLLTNEELRAKMGILSRQKIINDYSVLATNAAFLALFK